MPQIPDSPAAFDDGRDPAAIKAETDNVLSALEVQTASLNVLAGIEAALTHIAQNTTRVPEHVTLEAVMEAWPLRMYEDQAVPFLEALGIVVDK